MNKIILFIALTLMGCTTVNAIVPNASPTSNTYTCNSVTTQFSYQFGITATTDMQVFVTTAGVKVQQPTNTYSVDTYNKWVNYPLSGSPCPTGSTLLLIASTPITQQVLLTNRSPFVGSTIMGALDKLTLIDQQIQANANGSFWTANGGAIYNNNSGYVGIGIQNPRSALDVGTGGITLGGVTLSAWPAGGTSGSSILYGNGAGGFSNVTIGSNLTFVGGTLSASGGSSGSGTVSNGTIGNEAVYTGVNTVGSGIITDNGSSVTIAGPVTASSFTGIGSSLTNIPLTVSSSDGSLTVSPTTGAVIANMNMAHANTWTGGQTFNTSAPIVGTATASTPTFFNSSKALVSGSVSGTTTSVGTTSGTVTGTSNLASWDGNGNLINSGVSGVGASQWTTSGTNIYVKTYNVGIGTSAPLNFLDVNGGVVIGTTYGGAVVSPANGALIQGNVGIGTSSAINTPLVVNGQVTTLGTANTLLNTNGGNVGIGSTVPGQILDVQGTTRSTTVIAGTGGITLGGVNNTSWPSGTSQWSGNQGSFISILSTNVGIGSVNPTYGLQVYGSNVGIGVTDTLNSGLAQTTYINDSGNTLGVGFGGSTATVVPNKGFIGTYSNQDLGLFTNSIVRATIKGGGNMGIGTVSPQNALDITGGLAVGSYAGVNSAPSNGLIVSGAVTFGGSDITRYAASNPLFQVVGTAVNGMQFVNTGSYSSTGGSNLNFVNDNATALTNGARLGRIRFGGATDTSASGSNESFGATIASFAGELWTGSTSAGYLTFNTTPTGSQSQLERMRIDSTGNIGIGTAQMNGLLSIGGGCATHAGQPACIAATATGAALGYCNGGLSAACGTCTAC